MANNRIQIKRSVANATVTGLANGELAFTQASNTLYIGAPDGTSGSIPIAGKYNYGVLTANQALVSNSTSGIDKVITGNAVVTTLWANGAAGTNGQVLVTNGSAIYWGTGTSGSNTYVQFNDSGVANGVAGFTFNKVSNTLTISNTVSTNNLTTNYITANASTGTAGFILISGGATSNAYWITPTSVGAVNTAAQWAWTNTHTWFANLQINSTSLAWIGNTTTSPTVSFANSGVIQTGNSSVTASPQVIVANSLGTTTINTNAIGVNTVFATGIVNASAFTTTGNANATNFYSGANLVVNSTSIIWTGNTSTSPTITLANTGAITIGNSSTTETTAVISVANSTGNVQITPGTTSILATGLINASSFTVSSVFVANSITLNANGLVVNSTGAYVTGLTNSTSFNAGSIGTGTGGTVQNTTNFFVGNNTVNTSISATSINIDDTIAGVGLTANASGLYTGVVNAASHTVGTSFTANSTKVVFTGANIDATSAWLAVADMKVSGNLTVSGTVVSVNTQVLMVNDNIIELADNNTTTDVVDSGFFSPAGNATSVWYSGLVRQASKSTNTNPYFWLFGSNTNPNTAGTIDTSANSSTATLQAYLVPYGTGGAFVANSSNVQITANNTVGVNITANTLVLSNALAGTSGGTGKATVANNSLLVGNSTNGYNELTFNTTGGYVLQSNGTAIVYDVLDGGSF